MVNSEITRPIFIFFAIQFLIVRFNKDFPHPLHEILPRGRVAKTIEREDGLKISIIAPEIEH